MNRNREIVELAKRGDFPELRRLWESGRKFDLAMVFDRAVTDFRTVKRCQGHFETLKFCIDNGLDFETRADWMQQPIVCSAAMYGNHELVEYMLQLGLPDNPFIRASVGDCDFLVDAAKRTSLADSHDENGFNLLHYAAASGLGRKDLNLRQRLIETSAYLLAENVSPDLVVASDVSLTPALMCAWFGGVTEIMQAILETGQVDVASLHQAFEFTLEPHQRAGEPFHDVAQVILEHGFDINSIRPEQGRTVLHGSAHRGSTKAVRWLLQQGAAPNVVDDHGRTALHLCAIRNTHGSVANLLCENGADVGAVDAAGKIPLDYAQENKRTKVAKILSGF